MSTLVTNSVITDTDPSLHTARPSFIGLVSGELLKIRKQWSTWIMLIVLVGLSCLPFVITVGLQRAADDLVVEPGRFLSEWIGFNLLLLRIVSGIVLIIMTARVIGQDYSLGTIRIVLARGVGRIQLLLAKLTAVVIWAIMILLIGLALHALLTVALVEIKLGNLNAFNQLASSFWHDFGIYIGTIGINMAATILMATAISVLGRSLVFGLSLSLVWFPADNILVDVFRLIALLTQNKAWTDVTAYFLGPNLNAMILAITGREWSFGAMPVVDPRVDGTHTVVLTIIYVLIFAVAAFVLTRTRDVKE